MAKIEVKTKMSKRFTDTEKWRKGFVRSLEAPYKLLWLYILDECDHAGIWHVELDVASLRIGYKFELNETTKILKSHIKPFDNGEKWFIKDFVCFQYGNLNSENRVHKSVIQQLEKYGLWKDLRRSFKGPKDKDKAKDKEKDKEKKERRNLFSKFYILYPNKSGKDKAETKWFKLADTDEDLEAIIEALTEQIKYKEHLEKSGSFCPAWPNVSTWLNQSRWKDEIPKYNVTYDPRNPLAHLSPEDRQEAIEFDRACQANPIK